MRRLKIAFISRVKQVLFEPIGEFTQRLLIKVILRSAVNWVSFLLVTFLWTSKEK